MPLPLLSLLCAFCASPHRLSPLSRVQIVRHQERPILQKGPSRPFARLLVELPQQQRCVAVPLDISAAMATCQLQVKAAPSVSTTPPPQPAARTRYPPADVQVCPNSKACLGQASSTAGNRTSAQSLLLCRACPARQMVFREACRSSSLVLKSPC